MKNLIAASIIAVTCLGSISFAEPNCTKESKDKWQKESDFQKKLTDEGYKIKKFKVTKGNCYEIYGWNKEGKKVEIYFDPTNGNKVKENIE
ncbi:PepSY domain-containing protein [Bdellovibrio sp. HCB185ZH]|uniref:PepSY domain-containing protein n=1 Tax=Bdellovibrio sp. HCB185ZH TaxID=3394235 RepID=UPI0039A4E182